MKYCPNCGAKVPVGAKFCPSCGYNLTQSKVQPKNVVTSFEEEDDEFEEIPEVSPIGRDEVIQDTKVSGRELLGALQGYNGSGPRTPYRGNIMDEMRSVSKKKDIEVE